MTKMSDTPQDRSADGVPEVEQQAKLVTSDRAREIIDAGGAVHRDERYTGDYRYIVDSMGAHVPGHPLADREPVTPAKQRTGVSDVQASIADEVAALRAGIVKELGHLDGHGLLMALDRIAALVPQRATGIQGRPMFQHACGYVDAPPYDTPGRCANCGARSADGKGWQALYTLGGA